MIEKIVLRYLSLKSFSSFELKKKLTRRGFASQEIEDVIAKYIQRGFINDGELAERRMELYKRKGYGPRWIAAKLKTQGLKSPPYVWDEQRSVIQAVLQTPTFIKKERNKQIAALERRGFDLDVIFHVVRPTHSY